MRQVISDMIQGLVYKIQEPFNGGGNMNTMQLQSLAIKSPVILILSFIIVELLVIIIGKYIWNNVVVYLIDIAKPAKSIWQILGLSILIKLMTN